MANAGSLQEIEVRCNGIRTAFQESSFPLTPTVVQSLAELTGAEMSSYSDSFDLLFSTLPLTGSERAPVQSNVFNKAELGLPP